MKITDIKSINSFLVQLCLNLYSFVGRRDNNNNMMKVVSLTT